MLDIRTFGMAAAAVTLAACADSPVEPTIPLEIEGQYIVVFEDSVADPLTAGQELMSTIDGDPFFEYDGVISGFAAEMSEREAALLEADPRVAYVTPDKPVEVRPVTQEIYRRSVGTQIVPWGADSIGAHRSSTRSGNGSGAVTGVHVYVLDTGVASHPDLNVARRVNFAGGVATDCNGHGTHVAGTIAARDNSEGIVGVAPGAPIYSIKVLDCTGSGTSSAMIKGVNWVVKNARRPAVMNLSLGAPVHAPALHDAIVGAINRGITVVVAAGNANVNAGQSDPAHIAAAITVGASDRSNCKARFSNWGSVLDVFAPGTEIVSTGLDGGLVIMSGTSMAAPHVAGAAALFLSRNPSATPARVRNEIVNRARSAVTCGFSSGSHNTATTDRRLRVNQF